MIGASAGHPCREARASAYVTERIASSQALGRVLAGAGRGLTTPREPLTSIRSDGPVRSRFLSSMTWAPTCTKKHACHSKGALCSLSCSHTCPYARPYERVSHSHMTAHKPMISEGLNLEVVATMSASRICP